MKTLPSIAAGLLAAAAVAGAHADPLYTEDFSAMGVQAAPGSISASFESATAGNATLSFELAGYLSLDGADNGYSDLFTLAVNGEYVLMGSFNLGGGGVNVLYAAPAGTSHEVTTFGASDDIHHSTQATWGGGTVDFSLSIDLASGTNTLQFAYQSAGQGLGDEGWGLNAVNVTSAVPEPGSYALMLAGLSVTGFLARRRRRVNPG